MENTVAVAALASSAALVFLSGIAASLIVDGKLRYPLIGTLIWIILSSSTIALAFLAGSIWP